MFTGIVAGTAPVAAVSRPRGRAAAELAVDLGRLAAGLSVGQSVAVSGACLTVASRRGGRCRFEVIAETLRRTTLGSLRPGSRVNVERSLRAGARLEGHFVLGHVDGTGTVSRVERRPDETAVRVEVPARLARRVAEKGSVAVDGVSLTAASAGARGFSFFIVPHTAARTTLGSLRRGSRVNVETDVLAKYALARRRADH